MKWWKQGRRKRRGGGSRMSLELASNWKAASQAQSSGSEVRYPGSGTEKLEELSFVLSAVSDSAGWGEPLSIKYRCDNECNEEGFKFFDIAAILGGKRRQTAHDRPLSKLLQLQAGRKRRIKGDQCRVEDHDRTKGSRGRLSCRRDRWFCQNKVQEHCWRRRKRCSWRQAAGKMSLDTVEKRS